MVYSLSLVIQMFQAMLIRIYSLYFVCLLYFQAVYYIILQWRQKHKKPFKLFKANDNLVVLITGGAKGIGLETSRQLLKLDATVVIAGIYENQKEGYLELKSIYHEKVIFLECDLSSLRSVKELHTNFIKLQLPLHILINNAGVMFSPYCKTEDDHEYHWGINYLSHFYLTHLFIHHLTMSSSPSKPARIVNLSSCVHFIGTINFEDIESCMHYSAEAAYCQSKLAMVLFTKKLDRELTLMSGAVIVNSVHPAVVFTNLYKHVWWFYKLSWIVKCFLKTPAEGSDSVIHAALSEDVTNGGHYLENCQIVNASKKAQSLSYQEKLWTLSLSQLKIKVFGKCDLML